MDGLQPPGKPTTAVVVPVKSFDMAKSRLAESLDEKRRAELAQSMAATVVAAAKPLPTFVVCGSHDIAGWALAQGAGVLWQPAAGLNRAVSFAAHALGRDGYQRMIVAHGDLPLAKTLAWVAEFDGMTIVPDRRGEGSNVLALPLPTTVVFRYGPGSAERHKVEAERCGLAVRIAPHEELGWDVDTPDDLNALDERDRMPVT